MLQPILADRFKLKIHREIKEVPAYVLVIAENGPKMKEVKPGGATLNGSKRPDGAPHFPFQGNMVMIDRHQVAGQMSMSSLAQWLSSIDGRRIVDKTGLRPTMLSRSAGRRRHNPQEAASLQEYLGLKLEPTKVLIEVIVLDHIERPSEN